VVNVLSGAPYGYRYVKKTERSSAYYEILEAEATIVREIYRLYTEELISLGEIARRLNTQGFPTRKGLSPWERSTIRGILRNPAYMGKACYGKTEQVARTKITRKLRQRGGYSPRDSSCRERPKEEWIEIPVPPIIPPDRFALAQERLVKNKHLSTRRTKEVTLLQGMLVCQECGYRYYRSSTRTSKRKLYYYRCIGSDDYRHPNGRVCSSRPIRQDYLDELVWNKVLELRHNPELITGEIQRRLQEAHTSNPTIARKETLLKQKRNVQKGIDNLLDAYQEGLLTLEQLRKRIPNLQKRAKTIEGELHHLEAQAIDQEHYQQIVLNMENFVRQFHESRNTLDIQTRRKILQLIVKEILVGPESITIKHSIPSSEPSGGEITKSYLLCTRRVCARLRK
jgi:site-specific DNA recombinase